VNPDVNIAPLAHAGADQKIMLPNNSISLTGTGSDADGVIVSYAWTKISGPSSFNMVNANSPVTDVWGLQEGSYQFQLSVTDNDGLVGLDTVKVDVVAANLPPVADAGPDKTIALPTNNVTLNGRGTDADGTIKEYLWSQLTGPSSAEIVSPNKPVTLINGMVGGNYAFELTVTDNLGATGKDTVIISVAEPRLNLHFSSIVAYPNPVNDITNLEINISQAVPKLQIMITTMEQEVVYQEEIDGGLTTINKKLDFSKLSKGTYVITVYFGTEKRSIKIIRQ
jgi:hypothetical protein